MPIRVQCKCGQKLTLPEKKAGLRVKCPVCNEALTIPPAPPAGATELVAAATTRVQAEIVAAISGQRKAKTAAAPSGKQVAKPETKSLSPAAGVAKERPLAPPANAAPGIATPRPEPRAAAPRAAPQPPPRKSQAMAAAASPPPRTVAPKKPVAPPPLPTSSIAPATAIAEKIAPPIIEVKSTVIETPAKKTAKEAMPSSPTPSPSPSVETPKMRGVEHDPAKRFTVYQLGFGLLALAVASTYPAVMELVRHMRDPLSPGIENWAYLVLLLCGMQLAYAIYLMQLPDWSSVWVTMIVTATIAVFYAIGMGMSLMARPDNEVIAMLGLSQWHAGGYLSLWCFLLTMLTALLSYSMVRTSVKWHKTFALAMARDAD